MGCMAHRRRQLLCCAVETGDDDENRTRNKQRLNRQQKHRAQKKAGKGGDWVGSGVVLGPVANRFAEREKSELNGLGSLGSSKDVLFGR